MSSRHPKFCTNCGQQISIGENFCPNCGKSIEGMSQKSLKVSGTNLGYTQPFVWTGRRSLRSLWLWLILSIFLIGIPFVFYYYFNNKYTVEVDRIIVQEGIFSKKLFVAKKNQITDILSYQGFFARIWSYGDVLINTGGTSEYEVKIKGIADPDDFRDRIIKSLE